MTPDATDHSRGEKARQPAYPQMTRIDADILFLNDHEADPMLRAKLVFRLKRAFVDGHMCAHLCHLRTKILESLTHPIVR